MLNMPSKQYALSSDLVVLRDAAHDILRATDIVGNDSLWSRTAASTPVILDSCFGALDFEKQNSHSALKNLTSAGAINS
jgi:hypothetical protein